MHGFFVSAHAVLAEVGQVWCGVVCTCLDMLQAGRMAARLPCLQRCVNSEYVVHICLPAVSVAV